jgi:feruloyl esterase
VLEACDARDGVKDGVLENPRACTIDAKALGVTPAQAAAVQKIWDGAKHARTGAPIFPGFERGSEAGWSPEPVGYAVDYFKYIVFKDPSWDPKTLNFDGHLMDAERADTQKLLDATDSDLTPFTSRGGKLLMYHGWNDPGIPPGNVVTYYGQVQQKTRNAADSVRLFMVPGMNHCGGGAGTSSFDRVAALDQWVTTGNAPPSIPASRIRDGVVDRTRPLCPYPQVAVYKGSGSTDDAANFECKGRP